MMRPSAEVLLFAALCLALAGIGLSVTGGKKPDTIHAVASIATVPHIEDMVSRALKIDEPGAAPIARCSRVSDTP
jgi:hypothetical protein